MQKNVQIAEAALTLALQMLLLQVNSWKNLRFSFRRFFIFFSLFILFLTSCKSRDEVPEKTEDSLTIFTKSLEEHTSFFTLDHILYEFFPESLFSGQYNRIAWFDKVLAIYKSYKTNFEKIQLFYNEQGFDVIFYLHDGQKVFFTGGRMLFEEDVDQVKRWRPYTYYYPRSKWNFLKKSLVMGSLNYKLLYHIYGSTTRERRKNLVRIDFLGKRLRFSKQNEADVNLEKAGKEIALYLEENRGDRKIIKSLHSIATYAERNIEYKKQLSFHSLGIAIDLLPRKQRKPIYWYWTASLGIKWWEVPYDDRYYLPEKVVEIFEKYGFVYGGKWNKYDSMHFEYTPEMIYQKFP